MIEREQITAALAALPPQDREVLEYSLRRRVPDEDLATIFATSAADVARRRAAAVESLSEQLGVERGAELGQVLKRLLEAKTWEGLEPADAAPVTGHRPLGALADPEPGRTAAGAKPRRGSRRALVGVAVALAVVGPAATVAALRATDPKPPASVERRSSVSTFTPSLAGGAEPFPTDPQEAGPRYGVLRVSRPVSAYTTPGGKRRLRIRSQTEWKTPRVLSVVERRGQWSAVLLPELANGEVAWVRDSPAVRAGSVVWLVSADLSRRLIVVRRAGRVVNRFRAGVGRPTNPTPAGRYAVTDKLRVHDKRSPYGCCVIALTGHQTRLPPGWPGGDRLAIHATHDLGGIGRQVSLGCMRVHPRDARRMLNELPLGTPVFIQA